VQLVVPGDPIPWSRAAYNPKTRTQFVADRQQRQVNRIRDLWADRGLPRFEEGRPLSLAAEFVVKRPKAHYGTGRNANVLKDRYVRVRPAGRPDLNNLIKLFEDALTSVAWSDDDQIVMYDACLKRYALAGEDPRSTIRIHEL
jgi:Holliday junction resolvase RusA-like endonuclease